MIKKEKKFNSLVSLGEVKISPYIYKIIDNNKIVNFIKNNKKNLNRQNFKKVYFPYGIIYLSKVRNYIKHKTFYSNKTMFYKIKPIQCFEIDDIYDFYCAETIFKKLIKSWNFL